MTNANNFITFDPAVEAALSGGQQRRADSHLPQQQRRGKIKQRKKEQTRLPRRIGLELPPELKARLLALAAEHETTISQIAALLLIEGLAQLDAGLLDPDNYKVINNNSPRYQYNLNLASLVKHKNAR